MTTSPSRTELQHQAPRWIRTDHSSDLLNCLEHCLLCFTLARSDERNWKWCVTAAHSAAQIAMVIVLMRNGEYQHLKKDSRDELIAHLNASEGGDWPAARLKPFMDLYKAAKKSLPAESAPQHLKRDLDRLNTLRRDWTHFGDSDLSVSVGLARVSTLASIRLISLLPIVAPEYLYDTRTEAARHTICIETLLRLLAIDEMDGKPTQSEEERYAALLAQYDDDDV